MTTFTPTEEQAACIEAARSTSDNLIICALAGAAKTSTLVMISEAVQVPTLCLAFNKRIADEMRQRLPSHCEAMTLNSLGHRVWGRSIGRRLVVNTRKNYEILTELIGELSQSDKEAAYSNFTEILRAIEFGKTCGYVPSGRFPNAKRLMDDDEFFAHLEEEPTALEEDLIRRASFASIDMAFKGTIDFSDQILMPTVFPASFPQYPLVLIDEAQDLSALNHATLRKLAKKRLIAVGDECQSIYGFRGAHEDSMRVLEQSFSMRKLILSISFRCPQAVVREAQWRAPHMRWPEWAEEGEVRTLASWSAADLPETATILCRNNAPIFSIALALLRNGRYPQIVGNDIGRSLIKILKKFGPTSMRQEEVFAAIELWTKEKKRKSRNKGRVDDQAECLRIFAEQGANLGDAIAYAEHILAAHGPIQLMTIHKSKGLEWDDVFILDEHLIRDDQQDMNLRYVAQTRAKKRLTYVSSDGFVDGDG